MDMETTLTSETRLRLRGLLDRTSDRLTELRFDDELLSTESELSCRSARCLDLSCSLADA